jgi:hypothetical protein
LYPCQALSLTGPKHDSAPRNRHRRT